MSTGLSNQPITAQPGFEDILREREYFGGDDTDQSLGNRMNRWFDELMVQSGTSVSPMLLLTICMFFGVVLAGVVLLFQENPLTAAMSAIAGAVGPVLVIVFIRARRKRQLMQQLPAMIDELARAAKTGRSIEQCWQLVADDTPAPLGPELQTCARRMMMGEDLPESLKELPYRTGMVTLNILVTALSVHQQTGGDLVSVLERLSETIRDRLLFLGRLRAATTGSRATAILMLALPPAIVLFFTIRDANYFSRLMSSSWGQGVTILAVIMQLIGTAIILRILKNSQRS
jgi:tight adherence protein B